MDTILAQHLIIQPEGGRPVSITGPLVGIDNLNDVVQTGIIFLYPLAALILLFVLIWGGYDFLMSRGDAEKVNKGRQKITAAIIGFVLLMLSYLITQIIGFIFGVGGGLF